MPTNMMQDKNGFKLGTFSSNCSSGMTVTKSPSRWVNSWENNLKLGQMLDDAGIDFMLPIARSTCPRAAAMPSFCMPP